jgi:hypothetical protein
VTEELVVSGACCDDLDCPPEACADGCC